MEAPKTYACVRERICAQEEQFFSPYAMKSADTKGRAKEEKRCDFRTDFQRDRDRIIYSNSFKRLKNKTQVFFAYFFIFVTVYRFPGNNSIFCKQSAQGR